MPGGHQQSSARWIAHACRTCRGRAAHVGGAARPLAPRPLRRQAGASSPARTSAGSWSRRRAGGPAPPSALSSRTRIPRCGMRSKEAYDTTQGTNTGRLCRLWQKKQRVMTHKVEASTSQAQAAQAASLRSETTAAAQSLNKGVFATLTNFGSTGNKDPALAHRGPEDIKCGRESPLSAGCSSGAAGPPMVAPRDSGVPRKQHLCIGCDRRALGSGQRLLFLVSFCMC
jgi:hypothetical protein